MTRPWRCGKRFDGDVRFGMTDAGTWILPNKGERLYGITDDARQAYTYYRLFLSPRNKRHYTSAAEQLAALFQKRHIPVITTTKRYGKISKLLSTLWAITRNSGQYGIAILPLYGTPLNFIWHQSAAVLLKLFGKSLLWSFTADPFPGRSAAVSKNF